MTCQKCKKEIPEGSLYCLYCGAKQSDDEKKHKHRHANGTGYAYRRPGQRTWTARVTVAMVAKDGHVIQKFKTKAGFRTETEARLYCAKLKEEKEAPPKVPTLFDYWQQYEETSLPSLSKDKVFAYRKAWERLKDLHHVPMDHILTADMQRAINSQTASYYPARDMKTVLTHLFKLAAADGMASKDPPTLLVLPKLNETERIPFSDMEQAALWRLWESGCHDAAIPLVMIYTGMMPCELMGLTVRMVDLDGQQITGASMKTEVRKKSAVLLPDTIIPVISACMDGLNENDHLFPRSEQTFYDRYYDALAAAGTRRLTPYSCRHTTATALAITEGIAPQTIKKVMRWSSTRMLDRYAHPTKQDAIDAVNKIGGANV